MNHDKLILECVCGNSSDFYQLVKNQVDVEYCNNCGIMHQLLIDWNEQRYIDFYSNEYHEKFQELKQVITYQQRYNHDREIAKIRLRAYSEFLKPNMRGLDIGSSNSAFVHEANSLGYQCMGLEPGQAIGDDQVTIRGTLKSADLAKNSYNFVTMHDSIEHMVDVNSALKRVYNILDKDGLLIVDLPNYFVKEGQHHWKKIEHLWFFTKAQFIGLLIKHNFIIEDITEPIPGKLVFYGRKS